MYVILIFFYAVTIVGLYQICCLLFGKMHLQQYRE